MAEKTNFAQTCSLLSQYLKKEKRDMSFGLIANPAVPPTTMNLLTNMEKETNPARTCAPRKPSIDLLPHFAGKLSESTLPEPGSAAPMTIFYGGKVLVFNEIEADKAREIMGFAGNSKVISSKICSEEKPKSHVQQVQGVRRGIGSGNCLMFPASLQKFFEKRKERAAAMAPYQVNHQRASSFSHPKPEGQNNPRAQVEGQCSEQLELSL